MRGGVGVGVGLHEKAHTPVFLQQALNTKVTRVSAAVASGKSSFHSLLVLREERKLSAQCAALWVMELLAVTFSALFVSSSLCCGIVPQMWHRRHAPIKGLLRKASTLSQSLGISRPFCFHHVTPFQTTTS